jgi:hypothetical protein
MNEQVDPNELVASDEKFQDQICDKCNALIVMDMETGKPMCNCMTDEEVAARVAKARQAQAELAQVQASAPPQAAQAREAPPVLPAENPPQAQGDAGDAAPQQEMPVFSAKDALRAIPGAPTPEQIEAWKQEFGSVYTFPFDTKEIYIWRPMRRREWQMLQSNEALVKEEAKFQEQVVMRAILWPKIGPVELNLSRAGLVQTLFSVIMQGSYFLHPDFAITLVEEL